MVSKSSVVLVRSEVPLIVKLPLSSSWVSPLDSKEKLKLLIDVSESVAESVPIRLPIDAVSDIVLEVKLISVGGMSFNAK